MFTMLNFESYRRGFMLESLAPAEPYTAETSRVIELTKEDLPAVCPPTSISGWAWHPRNFLDVVNQDEAMCPYCGTRYRLPRHVRVHDHEFDARCLHQHRKRDHMDANLRRESASLPAACATWRSDGPSRATPPGDSKENPLEALECEGIQV